MIQKGGFFFTKYLSINSTYILHKTSSCILYNEKKDKCVHFANVGRFKSEKFGVRSVRIFIDANVKHRSAICLLTEESLKFMYTKGFIKKEMFNIH